MRRLAHLPKGVVLGFIDAGPFILMETPHAALAAPYHRNIKGNAAMLDIFLGPASERREPARRARRRLHRVLPGLARAL